MIQENKLNDIIDELNEITEDRSVPKNIKVKIKTTIATLNTAIDVSIKVNKALNELEGITDDLNIQPYTRTQIWNVVSLLEKI